MQGVHAEVAKFFTKSVQNYIISSRAVQGHREMQASTPEEKHDIVARWNSVKYDLKNFYQMKKKEKAAGKQAVSTEPTAADASTFDAPKTGWVNTKSMSFEERKKLHAQKEAWKKGYVDVKLPVSQGSSDSSSAQTSSSEDAELERAIQASVLKTSHGNAEDDAAVEAAIRESIRAVRNRAETHAEASPLPEKNQVIFDDEDYQVTDEEYQALIEQAIRQSMASGSSDVPQVLSSGVAELDSRDTAEHTAPQPADEDDFELRRAITESQNEPQPLPRNEDDEEELQRAIAASKEAMEQQKSQQTEEDIVLEYVKKQSLAEEEYRQNMAKGKDSSAGQNNEDDDEQLRWAMEESLSMSRGDHSGPSGS